MIRPTEEIFDLHVLQEEVIRWKDDNDNERYYIFYELTDESLLNGWDPNNNSILIYRSCPVDADEDMKEEARNMVKAQLWDLLSMIGDSYKELIDNYRMVNTITKQRIAIERKDLRKAIGARRLLEDTRRDEQALK